ncbi:hypothetical protein PsorP6_007777 [Peronosclerospora sorghi]|uniref:Uncharacterized protein n=1 Tax=Peronosclerospora sorghi TaxID=230839 RepID=A0ACC0WCP8_9STRA|nr:hypothetical protein PsorP6_007777 [Peronosclerospora sorghi]
MTEKVDAYLMSNNPKAQDSSSFQSTELRFERVINAINAMKKEELSKFLHKVIQPQIAVYSEKLEKVRQHDVKVRMYQKQAMDAQENVNTQLVEKAKLQAHAGDGYKAKKILEEAAFVSLTQVQLPEQNVIKSAQDNKQGGGGNVLNPLGWKNWKQRYFILSGTNLIFEDERRLRAWKNHQGANCRIDPASDAGVGFNITPVKSAHVFALQRGLFEKNNKKRSSAADNGRIFKLRAQNIQQRDVCIDRLRQAAGGC